MLRKRVFTERREINYFVDAHLARVPLAMKVAAGGVMKVVAGDTRRGLPQETAMKVAAKSDNENLLAPTSSTIA